jgi:hypothetical protein
MFEVQQVKYLIDLVKPFCRFTKAISRTKTPTIQLVFLIYNKLINHLNEAKKKLVKKRTPWKEALRSGIQLAKDKLKLYYGKTNGTLGHLYGHSILLSPHLKNTFFQTDDWLGKDKEWEGKYWESLKERFMKGYAHLPAEQIYEEKAAFQSTDEISMLLSESLEDDEIPDPQHEFDRFRQYCK